MNILSINSGSASLKFKLYKMPEEELLLYGHFKNYDNKNFSLEIQSQDGKLQKFEIDELGWNERTFRIFQIIEEAKLHPDVTVHRIVHGGEKYVKTTQLTRTSIDDLWGLSDLAPLHNPKELEIVEEIIKLKPDLAQYACFDTAFFSTMDPKVHLYGLPFEYYEKYKIRRYGFHGISHRYVLNELVNIFSRQTSGTVPTKVIICHLGSGSSISAIKDGKAIDSSMGFSPAENLIMATRVGEVDYDAIEYLRAKLSLNSEQISSIINNKSGLLGISGYTQDMKQLLADYKSNERAKLAIDMYVYLIQKQIGGFFAALSGLDALVFTAGIGAGSDIIRKMVTDPLDCLGVKVNETKNTRQIDVTRELDITREDSKAKVFVIPTNEELEMAREVYEELR